MDLLQEIKQLIWLIEVNNEGNIKVEQAIHETILDKMREYISDSDAEVWVKRSVKHLFVIENGKKQSLLGNHFDSNQSKVKFTVDKASMSFDELWLEITTKKKWLP